MKRKIITFLKSEADWTWLLRGLDQAARMDLEHTGCRSLVFPCLVQSVVNGRTVTHTDVTARELPALASSAAGERAKR